MSDHKFQNDNTDVDLKFKLEAIKEEPSIHENNDANENWTDTKFSRYLRRGYRAINKYCHVCNSILLRSRKHQVVCINCSESNVQHGKAKRRRGSKWNHQNDNINRSIKQKPRKKFKNKDKQSYENTGSKYYQLENKLDWMVKKLTIARNPNQIYQLSEALVKLTEAIEVLKKHEMSSASN